MKEDFAEKMREAQQEYQRRLEHVLDCKRCQEVIGSKLGSDRAGAAAECPEYKKEESKKKE